MKNITMVIPTFNSPEVLRNMLTSLWTNTDWEGRIIVTNNGEPLPFKGIEGGPLEIVDAGSNLGWMGGVNRGLAMADTEFFCMANDDLLFIPRSFNFWIMLISEMERENAGGVGPCSNYVSGAQNAFWHTKSPVIEVPYLIGMLALHQTEELKKLGGLDESLPGGDDLDLSIRYRDAGKKLYCRRSAYVHHIGSQTGRREQPSYWDSAEHQAKTVNALIKKHGLKKWADCWMGVPKPL